MPKPIANQTERNIAKMNQSKKQGILLSQKKKKRQWH